MDVRKGTILYSVQVNPLSAKVTLCKYEVSNMAKHTLKLDGSARNDKNLPAKITVRRDQVGEIAAYSNTQRGAILYQKHIQAQKKALLERQLDDVSKMLADLEKMEERC